MTRPEVARKAAHARANSLTPERRSAIARLAAEARWGDRTKTLKITQRDARFAAYQAAAALLKHTNFTAYEGTRIGEGDDETRDAFYKIEAEKNRIVAMLAKRAGFETKDLFWESDE